MESSSSTARSQALPDAVFHRGEPGYEEARLASCWNARAIARYPEVIVQAKSAEDVALAVRAAAQRGWTVGIRSGGHSWAGNHVRDGGMLLDVSRLTDVEIDPLARRARVGPGVHGDALNRELARRRLFFPIGHCQGVGLGGYLLQGGFGWNSRTLGLGCENVVGIDLVGADGVARHASATENADLFWAARGSGPGFFAAVTRFHVRLHPRPRVIGARLINYPIERLDDVVRWVHRVGPSVPRSIELMLLIWRRPNGRPVIQMIVPVFADSLSAAWRDLDFVRTRPRGASLALPFVPLPVSRMTASVMSHYPDNHQYAVDNMWTAAPVEDLLPGLRRAVATLPQAPSHILWMNWAPPPSRPDMAFSRDDQVYIALYGVWRVGNGEDSGAAGWAEQHMRALAPHATGIQLADENLGRRPAKFLSDANMARLDALRAQYDPAGRFHPYMGRP